MESRKKYAVAAGAVVLVSLIYWLFSSTPQYEVMRSLATACREEDIEGFMSLIHPEYKGLFGGSRQQLEHFVLAGFAAADNIKVNINDFEVLSDDGLTSTASMRYNVLARYRGQVMYVQGSIAKRVQVDVTFRKEGDAWKISGMTYSGESARQNHEAQRMQEYIQRKHGPNE